MTANETVTRRRSVNITLWVVQILLAVFFFAGAAIPKLVGVELQETTFDDIGIGQWFRYFVGVCELAGAIGLVIRALSGLAALGLAGVMIGAAFTQLFVLDDPVMAITPVILFVVFVLIAWGRWPETKALTRRFMH